MTQEVEFLAPSVQISKGETFAAILERFSYSFGKDENGNEIPPLAIPLCRLQNLKLVQNLNAEGPGVTKLKESFMLHGYVNAFFGFQLLLCDDNVKVQPLTDEIRSSWDPCWVEANEEFEATCNANPIFGVLKD
ncbi:unnamed protein product [Calypogeia fissa]